MTQVRFIDGATYADALTFPGLRVAALSTAADLDVTTSLTALAAGRWDRLTTPRRHVLAR